MGGGSCWKYFNQNKWNDLDSDTSKEIEETIKQAWKAGHSGIITFPITQGSYFRDHPGVHFCRLKLNRVIQDASLGNKETGNELPMKRNEVLFLSKRKQNKKQIHNNQQHRNKKQNKPKHSNQKQIMYKVMIPTSNGIQPVLMTQQQLQQYQYVQQSVTKYHNQPQTQPHSTNTDDNKQDKNVIVHPWDYKHIDEWTCNELQEWICSLNLQHNIEKKIVEAISEQQIIGKDFNTMEEYSEISDSFEIKETVSKKLWNALVRIRTQASNAKYHPPNSGIIGLKNLGNTCFINSVIQSLLQTPGLIDVLRIWPHSLDNKPKNTSWFGGNDMSTPSMLDAFIEVARKAFQPNSAHTSCSPTSIVKCLRNSDVKFHSGEQGDALSAVSKMLELLDQEMINKTRKEDESKHSEPHTGSWFDDGTNEMDEDERLECEWYKYNPNESLIRDYIHFVERSIFTCMQCGWQESRYDVKDKILLPLQDRNITVLVDIYIPYIKSDIPVFKAKKCIVLDYCPVETLRYQIFQQVTSGGHMEVNNINQISIHYLQPNKKIPVGRWGRNCNENENCSVLLGKSVFAVVNVAESDELFSVTTYNVFVDKGNIDEKQNYFELEIMKKGAKKSFGNNLKQGYPKKQIYIDEKVILDNDKYECFIFENKTVICIWMTKQSKLKKWNDYDMSNIDPMLVIDIDDKLDGNVPNWADTVEFIQMRIKETKDKAAKVALNEAVVTYRALCDNQIEATSLVYNAFIRKFNYVKREHCYVRTMKEGYNAYCSTKVMDRGAVVICKGNCGGQKSKVFEKEIKIIRFPKVLIFGIDRYMYGQKYNGCVGYSDIIFFDGSKYELYGVCNHTGELGYGHYWAYVKGVDDNKWYSANDSKIKRINVKDVINQATAILLFYKISTK